MGSLLCFHNAQTTAFKLYTNSIKICMIFPSYSSVGYFAVKYFPMCLSLLSLLLWQSLALYIKGTVVISSVLFSPLSPFQTNETWVLLFLLLSSFFFFFSFFLNWQPNLPFLFPTWCRIYISHMGKEGAVSTMSFNLHAKGKAMMGQQGALKSSV